MTEQGRARQAQQRAGQEGQGKTGQGRQGKAGQGGQGSTGQQAGREGRTGQDSWQRGSLSLSPFKVPVSVQGALIAEAVLFSYDF